jgi:hypothetical protein
LREPFVVADGLAQAGNHAVETSRNRVVSADDDVLLLCLPEAAAAHRRVLAVLAFLEAR